MRLWNSKPLILSGLNNVGIGFPSGCGSTAVPAGGSCAGVKYAVPGWALFTTLGVVEVMTRTRQVEELMMVVFEKDIES